MTQRTLAERVGTFVLAFAFEWVLLAMAHAIGPMSGCHVNPTVTLGLLLNEGISAAATGV